MTQTASKHVSSKSVSQGASGNFVEVYLDKLLDQVGIKNLTAAQTAYLRTELLVELEKRLKLVLLESLDEDGLAAYAELIQSGKVSLAEQISFFKSKVANLDELMKESVDEFAREFISHGLAIKP
ncbi:MAG: hypothetical protein HY974_00805 [Candidatus Kerfeldbacteria bacterium]|nr:hypothetical protein [Candidatus Kerfeldbacteria bacterium]